MPENFTVQGLSYFIKDLLIGQPPYQTFGIDNEGLHPSLFLSLLNQRQGEALSLEFGPL